MNHLAHLVLAGDDEGLRLGALLGDHVKGRLDRLTLPADQIVGIDLHRRIDSASDRHPAVRDLVTSLQPPWRRYGGIILDVLFDHMLARHWSKFAAGSMDEFGAEIDALLAAWSGELPPRLERFSRWAAATGLWGRYGERGMLAEIFTLIARRHGRTSPLADGLVILDRHDLAIEQAFLALMPDLLELSRRFRYSMISSI